MGQHGKGVTMFGWFKKPPASSPEPPPPFRRDANGRAIRPDLPGLTIPEQASEAEKGLAVEWALDWTGSSALNISVSDLVTLVDQGMAGKALKARDPAYRVVASALRCLRSAAQDNRAARASKFLPWMQFRLGPQENPCRLARDLDRRLIPCADHPPIPLPGCDAEACKCWFEQLTNAAAKREA